MTRTRSSTHQGWEAPCMAGCQPKWVYRAKSSPASQHAALDARGGLLPQPLRPGHKSYITHTHDRGKASSRALPRSPDQSLGQLSSWWGLS